MSPETRKVVKGIDNLIGKIDEYLDKRNKEEAERDAKAVFLDRFTKRS